MKIRCIIIDDESLAINVIENHLKSFDHVEIIATFNNPLKAYNIIEHEKIDVDIYEAFDGFSNLHVAFIFVRYMMCSLFVNL